VCLSATFPNSRPKFLDNLRCNIELERRKKSDNGGNWEQETAASEGSGDEGQEEAKVGRESQSRGRKAFAKDRPESRFVGMEECFDARPSR
jgi:hypothetical protein